MRHQPLADHAVTLFSGASPDELGTRIPHTPLWDARDVLAHLVNGAERALAGENTPLPDEQAHAAVVARRHEPVGALLDRLRQSSDLLPPPSPGPSIVWDATVHLADVREAWGRPPLPPELWRPVLEDVMAFNARTGRLACRVQLEDATCAEGMHRAEGMHWGEGPLVLVHDAHQLFRVIFGRRPLCELAADGDLALIGPAVFFA